MAQSLIANTWDAEQSLRLLHNFTHLIQRKDNFMFGLKNLSILSERFYEKAIVSDYQTKLTCKQQLEIRHIITKLADFVPQLESHLGLESLANLFISLLKCLHYAFAKTVAETKDAFYCLNAYKLSILTATFCYDLNDFYKMSWCLKEASFLRHHGMSMPFKPTEMKTSYILNENFLALLRVLCIQKFSSQDTLCSQLKSLYNVELCYPQTELIAKVIWNMSVESYKSEDYTKTIELLELAHSFGKRLLGRQRIGLIEKVICLMAASIINLGDRSALKYLVWHHLADDTSGLWEARLQMAIFTKSEPRALSNVTKNLLSELMIIYEDKPNELRENSLKVLKLLEDRSYTGVMANVLEELQWRRSLKDAAVAAKYGNSGLWIFAEIALRLCLSQQYQEGAYEILHNLAALPYTITVNCKAARCILTLAEKEVSMLQSVKEAFKWYQALLRIRHHIVSKGISEQSIVENAIRCSISYGSLKSLEYASNLLEQIDHSYGFNFQCARRMLLVAILRAEKAKASEIWARLDDWTEALMTLEHCVTASLSTPNYEDTALSCLTAIAFEEKLRSRSSAIIVRVIKFHLELIFANGREQSIPVMNKCIDNLIAILISSYLNGKENATLLANQFNDGIDLWFGNLAWFLAQRIKGLRPFQRHQLFKLSYKLFLLAQDRDSSIDQRISDAIVLAVAAGINSFDEEQLPYTCILQRCLEIIRDFHGERDRHKSIILRLYEFFILCQIGNLEWISQFIEHCVDDLSYGHEFFEFLSTLASSRFNNFLSSIMPTTEYGFVLKGALRTSRMLKSQTKLNMVAVACLKISIERVLKEDQTTRSQGLLDVIEKWKKAFIILSEGFISCKETEEQLFKLFTEFLRFAKMALDSNHSIEVNEFFDFCCNAVMEMKICKSSENFHGWIELLENFGLISGYTQKALRMFKREHLYRGNC